MHEVLFHRLLIIISLNFNGICMLLSLRHIIHGLTFLALRGGGLEVVNTHTSDKEWNRKLMKSNNTCNYYEHFD